MKMQNFYLKSRKRTLLKEVNGPSTVLFSQSALVCFICKLISTFPTHRVTQAPPQGYSCQVPFLPALQAAGGIEETLCSDAQ